MSENGKQATRRTGATLFSELVRAHYRREAEAENGVVGGGEAQADFEAKLTEFEHDVGQIDSVYWSSRRPSAVALTIGEPHGVKNPFKDTETDVRLHRVTDWVTGGPLRDRRLAARLLGFFERTDQSAPRLRWWALNGKRDMDREEQRLVAAQRQELARIEEYYLRIAGKAGRIVYVSGMIAGALFIALVCALVAAGLAVWYPQGWTANERYLLLCAGAGAAGALTSVLARMNSIRGSFTIDVELGRPLLRRLGLYKPFVPPPANPQATAKAVLFARADVQPNLRLPLARTVKPQQVLLGIGVPNANHVAELSASHVHVELPDAARRRLGGTRADADERQALIRSGEGGARPAGPRSGGGRLTPASHSERPSTSA